MTRRALPPALEPYLRLPPETSLILLTSTLGCSVNWLTSRFITSTSDQEIEDGSQEPRSILLASWLRDEAFWKGEAKRVSGTSRGVDFSFVDCFSSFRSLAESEALITAAAAASSPPAAGAGSLLVVLDAPDVLIATASTTAAELNACVLRLRRLSRAVVLACAADWPLVSAVGGDGRPSPMELECAGFVAAQAHAARLVMSVRELETGAARDVSGVVRVTRGGGFYDVGGDEDGQEGTDEAEMLYLVLRDGSAKVFSRSAGVD